MNIVRLRIKVVPGSFLVREKVLPDRGTLVRSRCPWPPTSNDSTSLRSRTATLEFSVAGANGLALLVNRWRTRENNASRAKHGRKTSQHEDENGDFGSVVPTQTKRYLREFSTNLNETKINS
jgi:hypothetical protein